MYQEVLNSMLELAGGSERDPKTLYNGIENLTTVEKLELEKELAILGYRLVLNQDEARVELLETELLKEVMKLRKSFIKSTAARQLSDKDTVKTIYSLYIDSGCSLNDIVDYLMKNSYKTYKGGKWYRASVKLILQNESYVELGYVTKEQYDKANLLLKENRRNKAETKKQ